MASTRVLIIEDDADINNIVATHLTRAGYTCTQAFSGTEAKLLLDSGNSPMADVVICDLMLPGLPGEELVRLMRECDQDTPIIVISARTAASDKIDLLKLGADDYLAKPFDLDELLARIEVQLRHHGRSSAIATSNDGVLRFSRLDPGPSGTRLLRRRRAAIPHPHRVQHHGDPHAPPQARVHQAGAF